MAAAPHEQERHAEPGDMIPQPLAPIKAITIEGRFNPAVDSTNKGRPPIGGPSFESFSPVNPHASRRESFSRNLIEGTLKTSRFFPDRL